MPMGAALALVPVFSNDPSRHIVSVAGSITAGVKKHLVPQALAPNYARFIRAMFDERARSPGFEIRTDEDDDTRLLRQTLVNLVANAGEDPVLRAEATKRARRWLIERQPVDADTDARLR